MEQESKEERMSVKDDFVQAIRNYAPSLVEDWHSQRITCDQHIKAEIAERILYLSFLDYGLVPDYNTGSHVIGSDIFLKDETDQLVGLSVKTGTTTIGGAKSSFAPGRQILTFSGSRTTKYKTLADKIEFMNRTKPNYFVCFSRESSQQILLDEHLNRINPLTYNIYVFDGSLPLANDESQWVLNGSNMNFTSDVLKLDIQHSMSDQIWYKMVVDESQMTKITITV